MTKSSKPNGSTKHASLAVPTKMPAFCILSKADGPLLYKESFTYYGRHNVVSQAVHRPRPLGVTIRSCLGCDDGIEPENWSFSKPRLLGVAGPLGRGLSQDVDRQTSWEMISPGQVINKHLFSAV